MYNKQILTWELCQQIAKNEPGKEHSELQSVQDLVHNPNYSTYRFGDAPPENANGDVISTYRDGNGNLLVTKLNEMCHCAIIATTGSGKTQGALLNQILCANGRKSKIVFDKKGEITERAYAPLVEKYGVENVLVANYMQPEHSTIRINTLKILGDQWLYAENVSPAEAKEIRDEIAKEVRNFVDNLCPVSSHKEPSWEETAKNFIFAIIIGLFEDLTLSDSEARRTGRTRTTPEQINIDTVIKIFHSFSWERTDFQDNGYFSSRKHTSLAYVNSQSIVNNATTTRANYMGFVDRYLQKFDNANLRYMAKGNDIDIESFARFPKVLFVVYDSSDRAQLEWISFLSAYLLSRLLQLSHKTAKPLPVTVLLLIDEFSSLKPNDIYPTVLATGRGSNIFMTLVLQSLGQLEAQYPNSHVAMLNNCGVTMYLGSADIKSAAACSEQMGKTTIASPTAYLMGQYASETVPLVTTDTLMHRMERGECYICSCMDMPIHGNFELYYKTPEYLQFGLVPNSSHSPLFDPSDECEYTLPRSWDDDDDDDDDDFFVPCVQPHAKPSRTTKPAKKNATSNSHTVNANRKTAAEKKSTDCHKDLFEQINNDPSGEWEFESEDEFETKCMDVIEKIVLIDKNQDRQGAIDVAKAWLDLAKAQGRQDRIKVYERVVHEFVIATDNEYDILKRQLFE